MDLSLLVGGITSKLPAHPVGDLEPNPFQRLAGFRVYLLDLQVGIGVVFVLHHIQLV